MPRQGESHPGALLQTVRGHLASLFTDELTHEVQADAQSPVTPAVAPLTALEEPFEDPLLVTGIDPDTLVVHVDRQTVFAVLLHRHPNSTTLRRELQSVLQQLVHHHAVDQRVPHRPQRTLRIQ